MIRITINGSTIEAESIDTILKAAQRADIYIPTLCCHPDLPPRKGGKPVDAVYQGELRIENHPEYCSHGGLESG